MLSKCLILLIKMRFDCIESGEKMVRLAGVEPTTFGFGGRHSIQLSYRRTEK